APAGWYARSLAGMARLASRQGRWPALAPGHAHMARERRPAMAAIDDEVVALGFSPNRLVDRGKQKIVAFGCAQRLAQVGGILLAEAHIEGAGAGDAHPGAG